MRNSRKQGSTSVDKVKWTSERGIGIEEPKKPIPQGTSLIARILQLIKRIKK